MSVSTIYQTQNKSSKHYMLLYILIIIGLLAVVYFGVGFVRNYLALGAKSSLSTELFFGEGTTYLNNDISGPTPYQSDSIKSGDNTVTIKGTGVEYEVTLDFLPNSEVVMKRDLGISQVFSGGQNFWLTKNDASVVLSVISEPKGADVLIDGTKVGTTPYSSSELSEGDYDLRVEYVGYEAQTARIDINKKYNLNASISLFPKPVNEQVLLLEGSAKLYDVYSDNVVVNSDYQSWVNAVIYWNKTRGVNLSGAGLNKELVFDFYLDGAGNLYDKSGIKLNSDQLDTIKGAQKGAYLRKVSDGPGLTEAAKATFLAMGESGIGAKMATILDTGNGVGSEKSWLRVRDEPGLNGVEITKVYNGDKFEVLEEEPGWVKIKVSADITGWVSDTYVSVE